MTEQYFEWKFYSEIIPVIIALAMVAIILIIEGIERLVKAIKKKRGKK